jgi:hypothetical protein
VGEAQRGSRSLFTSHAVGRDDASDTLNVQCSAVYTALGSDTSALTDKCCVLLLHGVSSCWSGFPGNSESTTPGAADD